MSRADLAALAEALGGCLIVLGLVFWSLPLALIVAGLFLVAVANAPGGAPDPPATGARGAGRAEARQ